LLHIKQRSRPLGAIEVVVGGQKANAQRLADGNERQGGTTSETLTRTTADGCGLTHGFDVRNATFQAIGSP
jgi:hypothetical protein